MKLVEMNWSPSSRELRQFGLIALVAFPFLGWLWGAGPVLLTILAIAGCILALIGLAIPSALKPIYLALCLITLPIGMIVGEVMMAVMFYGVFLPIGLVFRLLGRDALELRLDRQAQTYWAPKKKALSAESYFQQW
jgi:hypothetical protein